MIKNSMALKVLELFGVIVLCAVVMYLFSWHATRAQNPTLYKYNRFRAVVVELQKNRVHVSNDTTKNTQLFHAVLFRIIDPRYPNQYFLLRSLESRILTNAWVYNHRVGDTAYFEYINDRRVFSIRDDRK